MATSINTEAPTLGSLPTEILIQINKELDLATLSDLTRVDRFFYTLNNPLLYRKAAQVCDSFSFDIEKHSIKHNPTVWAISHGNRATLERLLNHGLLPNTLLQQRPHDKQCQHDCRLCYGQFTTLLITTIAMYNRKPTMPLSLDDRYDDPGQEWYDQHYEGFEAMVKLLLDHGAALDIRDLYHGTPLKCAIRRIGGKHVHGNSLVRLLLDHGASVEESENVGGGHTPLQAASYWGKLEVMQTLLEYGAAANRRRDFNNEELPLNLALMSGAAEKKERVMLLLDHGADVTLRNFAGETVLHILAEDCPDWLEGVELLVGLGADINAEDTAGYRPLHCATESGNLGMIKTMLKHGANIDDRCRAEANGTVLHLAVSKRSDGECAKFFLEKGLSVDTQDNSGNTPLHKAVEWDTWINIQPKNIECVKLLLENGASVNAANHIGETPMHKAVADSFLGAVEVLLEYKADVNARNRRGMAPFHRFYYHREFDECNIKIAEVLLQHGADVNMACYRGHTPLHRIIRQYMATIPMIKKLISWGASTEAKNFRGMTPLHNALRLGGLTTEAEWTLEEYSERTHMNDIVEELLKCGSRLDVLSSGGNTALHFAILPAVSVAYQAEEDEDWDQNWDADWAGITGFDRDLILKEHEMDHSQAGKDRIYRKLLKLKEHGVKMRKNNRGFTPLNLFTRITLPVNSAEWRAEFIDFLQKNFEIED